MLEFFRMAEATRDSSLSERPLVQLMREAAEESGWHTEYIPNLQSKTKYAVRYDRPLNSAVVAELACRMKGPIMKFLSKREIDHSVIDSYIGYGFFNFIKTYKPDRFNTDEEIKAAIYRSVQNKVDQSNRKEIFRYRPTMASQMYQSGSSREQVEEEVGEHSRNTYINTPKEISFSSPVKGQDGEGERVLGDFIADTYFSPVDEIEESEGLDGLITEYASEKVQEIVIKILVEAGAHGRLTLRSLQEEVISYPEVREEVESEIRISISRRKEKRGLEEESFSVDEMVNNRIARKVKLFYRELKEKLGQKSCI